MEVCILCNIICVSIAIRDYGPPRGDPMRVHPGDGILVDFGGQVELPLSGGRIEDVGSRPPGKISCCGWWLMSGLRFLWILKEIDYMFNCLHQWEKIPPAISGVQWISGLRTICWISQLIMVCLTQPQPSDFFKFFFWKGRARKRHADNFCNFMKWQRQKKIINKKADLHYTKFQQCVDVRK